MNRLNHIKFFFSLFSIAALLAPQTLFAQHFGHGGGGFHGGGGGGGFHAAPARGGGGGFHNISAPRSINGGAHNFGFHPMPAAPRGGRGFADHGNFGHPMAPGIRNEGVFHHSYGFRPYAYHPYHPYVWGRYWHPFGFFLGALTADAIMFNMDGGQYYYDEGVYYQPSNGGYTAVAPPIGATVSYLPDGYETVQTDNGTDYYYGGVFYVQVGDNSFRVVPAPVGAIVSEIPEGATQQNINGESYLLYNNAYYIPISQDGQDAYQVVQIGG